MHIFGMVVMGSLSLMLVGILGFGMKECFKPTTEDATDSVASEESIDINPASGLPMQNGVDISGNPVGSNINTPFR